MLFDWMAETSSHVVGGGLDLSLLAWAGLFLFMTTEEIGLPAPLVSSTIVLALGYDAGNSGQGAAITFMALQAIVIGSSLVGASAIYWTGRSGARPLVDRLAKRFGAGGRVDRLDEWFAQRGHIVVLYSRLTPGLLTIGSLMAGVLRVPYGVFCLYVSITASIWTAAFFAVGFIGGTAMAASGIAPLAGPAKFVPVVLAALALATLPVLLTRKRRPSLR